MKKKSTNSNVQNFAELEQNYQYYLNLFYSRKLDFIPPIYFHEKTLQYCKKHFLSGRHIENIYATLVAWGMHRAGSRGAKMPAFKDFMKSVMRNKACLERLVNYRIEDMSQQELEDVLPCLTRICFDIQASTTRKRLVSSSKTLAHILPNLVCPIDNYYTLTFFKSELKGFSEQQKFQHIMRRMWEFYKNVGAANIKIGGTFAHSYPKMFDNLIMEF